MHDTESQFFQQLITAAWPLSFQIIFALGIIACYYIWSLSFYRIVDPWLRVLVGRALGANIIWVYRHSSSYQTAAEFGFTSTRYYRWSWGIEAEHQRTFMRDSMVAILSVFIVNILSGLWTIAIFLFVFIYLKALSYIVFFPTCIIMVFLYGAFWSGRYEVKGMR